MLKVLCMMLVSVNVYATSGIDELVLKDIQDKHIPGAVVIVGTGEKVLFEKAYGLSEPGGAPAVLSTRYDLASLTKPLATTTLVMQLIEEKKLRLEQTLAEIYPQTKAQPIGAVTIEHLLRHRAGLGSGIASAPNESREELMNRVLALPLVAPVDSKTHYSDLSFILLGAIVEKTTGESLSELSQSKVFAPLKMTQTEYADRIVDGSCALAGRERCKPHDPTAFNYFPKPLGHAGLFAPATDVAKFASFMLQALGGKSGVLSSSTVKTMVTLTAGMERGLGWDLLSTLAENPRGGFTKGSSFGHTGFTGTSLWIDPERDLYLVVLSNRVLTRPETSRHMSELRRKLSEAVIKAFKEKIGGTAI